MEVTVLACRLISGRAVVYSEPDEDSPAITDLKFGDEFESIPPEKPLRDGWISVRLEDGREGYVRGSRSYVIRPVTLAQRTAAAHAAPSEQSGVIRILRHFDEFTVAGPAHGHHDWIEVRFPDGEIAYIRDHVCFRETEEALPPRSVLSFEQTSPLFQRSALILCGTLLLLPGMAGLFVVALGLFLYGYMGGTGHHVTMADLPLALRAAALGTVALSAVSLYFWKRDIDLPSLPLWWLWTGYLPALMHEILLVKGWGAIGAGLSNKPASHGGQFWAGAKRAAVSWIVLLAIAVAAVTLAGLANRPSG
jgi:hypothetical protein